MFSFLKICVRRSQNNSEYFIQVKNYCRWTHRRPVRVLIPNEQKNASAIDSGVNHENIEDKTAGIQLQQASICEATNKAKQYVNKTSVVKSIKKQAAYDMLETVVDANGELVYTKLPNKDPKVTSLLTSLQSNSRKEKKSILLEGKCLIKEALQNNCKLEYLLFSRKDDVEHLKEFLPKSGAKLYKMPYKEIQLWSDLTTCPGIMGIFKKVNVENFTPLADSVPITIICDNIREPGNLGSILRTSAGVGCQNVILTKGCVNLWDSKVIRSSCGAHFRLKIHSKIDWSEIEEHIQSNSKIFMADNNIFSSPNQNVEEIVHKIQSIPLVPYYGIHIHKSESLVLMIGGETEGLSENAYKFVYDSKGLRLNIPLSLGVDSLNSGVALGVILFEMKKQMLLNSYEGKNIIHNIG